MQTSINLITGEQISKFSTLVKRQNCKLGANDIIRLNPHLYKEYIQKIKHFAGKTSNQKSTFTAKQLYSSSNVRKRLMRQPSAELISQSPSYYYANNLEIMSMKEFIMLLQESKRKQHREQRALSRIRQQKFIKQVDRHIQSSHSCRNLRLTSSSAHRISSRIRQKQYQGMYDK